MSCLRSNHSSFASHIIPILLIAATTPLAEAYTLFESATIGPTGIGAAGWEISSLQFIGVRFQVTSPSTTTKVGGHLVETPFLPLGNHQVFAAIVALSGPDDVPDSFNLSTPDVLGTTLLTVPTLSEEISAPLSVSLEPGWYNLVFGSGRFGATGHAALTANNFDIGRPSYYRQFAFQYIGGVTNMRMFVEAVPEPSGILMLLTCLGAYTLLRR